MDIPHASPSKSSILKMSMKNINKEKNIDFIKCIYTCLVAPNLRIKLECDLTNVKRVLRIEQKM